MQKTARKKKQILEKWENFENRPFCKGYSPCKVYSPCKMVSLGEKLKMPKTWEKPFYKIIIMFLCKNRSKKQQILEKWDNFENRPCCKGYSPCKVYSLCKMVSLGQKLKMPKTCEKPFYNIIRVAVCKKNSRKKTKYWRNKKISKFGHLTKAIAHAKSMVFAKWSIWVKN